MSWDRGGISFSIWAIWKQRPLLNHSCPAGHHRWTITCGGSVAFRLPWKLMNPNEKCSLPAWHAAFEPRWGEITVLQPLIHRSGTPHHAACATPEGAGAALAGAFQNSLYEVLQCHLRHSWSLNYVTFMQAVTNETGVYCISGWFSIHRQSIHLSITFKLFTSDEQLRSKLHLTRHAKPFSPCMKIIVSSFWLFFKFRSDITHT